MPAQVCKVLAFMPRMNSRPFSATSLSDAQAPTRSAGIEHSNTEGLGMRATPRFIQRGAPERSSKPALCGPHEGRLKRRTARLGAAPHVQPGGASTFQVHRAHAPAASDLAARFRTRVGGVLDRVPETHNCVRFVIR